MPALNRLLASLLPSVHSSRSLLSQTRTQHTQCLSSSLSAQFTLRSRTPYKHLRWQSQDAKTSGVGGASKIYMFEDIKSHIASPSSLSRILIDTREPSELAQTGRIPGSINIPITTAPDSFFITDEAFEDRFGFERPGKDKEVVFYCKAGVRSRAAAELARQGGWEMVGEYAGSWMDWEKRGGDVERK